jgi:hypothetical protein
MRMKTNDNRSNYTGSSNLLQKAWDFGMWISDFGMWVSDFGMWISDFGMWISDFRLLIPKCRFQIFGF